MKPLHFMLFEPDLDDGFERILVDCKTNEIVMVDDLHQDKIYGFMRGLKYTGAIVHCGKFDYDTEQFPTVEEFAEHKGYTWYNHSN